MISEVDIKIIANLKKKLIKKHKMRQGYYHWLYSQCYYWNYWLLGILLTEIQHITLSTFQPLSQIINNFNYIQCAKAMMDVDIKIMVTIKNTNKKQKNIQGYFFILLTEI